MNDVEQSKT